MEMILSFLAMKWYQYVSDLVIVCKNMHNLDTVVDLGVKVINLKLKRLSIMANKLIHFRSFQMSGL